MPTAHNFADFDPGEADTFNPNPLDLQGDQPVPAPPSTASPPSAPTDSHSDDLVPAEPPDGNQAVGPSSANPFPSRCSGPTLVPETPEATDLVSGVLGIQLDSRAPTVYWTSGQQTVLPFLPKVTRKHRMKNVLSNDARYVRDLAKFPESGPHSSLVVYLDKGLNKIDLFKAAREALSHNKTVIVKDFVETHGFKFTLEDLEDNFMVSPLRPVEAHGMS